MIVAERKPFEEIVAMTEGVEKLLILGCGSCVSVCLAGGEKEVKVMASTLRLATQKAGRKLTIRTATIERQCDREFYNAVADDIEWADAVLSMGCGVGVQYGSEVNEGTLVLPALNTKFYGANLGVGVWGERCCGCGTCVLEQYGSICPIARCSKSLLNGPCGGSQDGMCEVDQENIECGWQLIVDRLTRLGRLHQLDDVVPLKDWSTGRDGGPGKIVQEDAAL